MVSRLITLATLLLTVSSLSSQSCFNEYENNVNDGDYIRQKTATKRVVPYVHVCERDVLWKKRVWRSIDLREKINHPLFYPEQPLSDRASLWDIIKCASLNEKSITIYDLGPDFDDQFKYPVLQNKLSMDDEAYNNKLRSYFGEMQIVPALDANDEFIYDVNTGDQIFDTLTIEYTSTDIIRYEIKEEVFFNSKYSRMMVRIIGISPVVYYKNPESGDIMGTRNLFWLYFPECRYVFQNHKVFNPFNDAMEMTFDDLFWKRQFSSSVIKESNIFDRTINQYADGKEALLESEKIKEDILNFEQDLWHY